MIKIRSYGDKLMMDFFETGSICTLLALTIMYIIPTQIGAGICLAIMIYLTYSVADKLRKMLSPKAYLKNCWWEPGKE